MIATAAIESSSFVRSILSGIRLLGLQVLVVWLIMPSAANAQVTFAGTSASENFGSQPIGAASQATAINFSISSGTKVGSIAVLTTGVANLDFMSGSSNTCAAQTYASGTTCAINVSFTPLAAGLRIGAVVFYSGTGNKGTVLSYVPLYGVGTGSQIAFMGPETAHTVVSKVANDVPLANPIAVTVDAAGNQFVLDSHTAPSRYRLVEIPVGGGKVTAVDPIINGVALYLPSCLALDGAGDIFIGEFYGKVVELPSGGGPAFVITPTANGIALNYPSGMAVDGAGDLFIADFLNNRVLEVPASGAATIAIDPTVNGVSLDDPHGLAVDAAGDLIIADLGNNRVVTVPAGGGAATAIDPVVNDEGLSSPEAVAVDGAGDLFIADNANLRVVEVPAGGQAAIEINPTWLDGGYGEVSDVAVDGAGDLFIVEAGYESGPNLLEELERSTIPVLNYGSMTDVGSTDTTDGSQTVEVVNVGDQNLIFTGLNVPADFSENAGDPAACTGSTSLSPGQQCDLIIQFTPADSGALNEMLVLTDNASNIAGAQQSIVLTGNAQEQAEMVSPAPNSVLPGPNATFSWTTASSGCSWYMLTLGSTGPGSKDVYNSGYRTVTTWPVTGLPINGEIIYARLITNFSGVKLISDYIYSAALPAQLSSPAAGAILTGSSVAFAWTPGAGATGYELRVGSTGAGSNNIFDSKQVTGTSASAGSVPSNGETIYVRLITSFPGAAAHSDYTLTAATISVLTSPASGAVLAGTTVNFVSSSPAGVSSIQLMLGNTGPGSSNVYNSGAIADTSITVTGLPTNGEKIYARLYTSYKGATTYIDSIYTAAGNAKFVLPASTTGAGGSKSFSPRIVPETLRM